MGISLYFTVFWEDFFAALESELERKIAVWLIKTYFDKAARFSFFAPTLKDARQEQKPGMVPGECVWRGKISICVDDRPSTFNFVKRTFRRNFSLVRLVYHFCLSL